MPRMPDGCRTSLAGANDSGSGSRGRSRVNPKLVVLDEPVAALDLSAQARVLNLFKDLQREMGMAYLFITHDLSVAEYMADRILVMYAGKVMEIGDRARCPGPPATSVHRGAPVRRGARRRASRVEEIILEGDPPSAIDPPSGCRFNTRCPYAGPICTLEEPALFSVDTNHSAACHLLTGKLAQFVANVPQAGTSRPL